MINWLYFTANMILRVRVDSVEKERPALPVKREREREREREKETETYWIHVLDHNKSNTTTWIIYRASPCYVYDGGRAVGGLHPS